MTWLLSAAGADPAAVLAAFADDHQHDQVRLARS